MLTFSHHRLFVLCAAALLAFLAAGADAQSPDALLATGPGIAIDGSHIEVAGRRFKLYGIDTPDVDETCDDSAQKAYPCGVSARDALAAAIKGKTVSCLPRGPNEINEMLAVCSVGRTDLSRALAEAGWAIADRARTMFYEEAELSAREAKLGLWQGHFVPPANWRAGQRVPQGQSIQKLVE